MDCHCERSEAISGDCLVVGTPRNDNFSMAFTIVIDTLPHRVDLDLGGGLKRKDKFLPKGSPIRGDHFFHPHLSLLFIRLCH
jgi:hypothetical protein